MTTIIHCGRCYSRRVKRGARSPANTYCKTCGYYGPEFPSELP